MTCGTLLRIIQRLMIYPSDVRNLSSEWKVATKYQLPQWMLLRRAVWLVRLDQLWRVWRVLGSADRSRLSGRQGETRGLVNGRAALERPCRLRCVWIVVVALEG